MVFLFGYFVLYGLRWLFQAIQEWAGKEEDDTRVE